jgi:hypothetical protein
VQTEKTQKDGTPAKGRFQSRVQISVLASAGTVWNIIDDISLIPAYHPEVGRVDLISGKSKRAAGVRYQCSILEGRKGTCIEEVVAYVPIRKISTAMYSDSWGLEKMFAHFVVDTTLEPIDDDSCTLRLEAYYDPVGVWNAVMNVLVLRRVFRKRSLSVMEGIRRLAEKKGPVE